MDFTKEMNHVKSLVYMDWMSLAARILMIWAWKHMFSVSVCIFIQHQLLFIMAQCKCNKKDLITFNIWKSMIKCDHTFLLDASFINLHYKGPQVVNDIKDQAQDVSTYIYNLIFIFGIIKSIIILGHSPSQRRFNETWQRS